MTSPTMSVSVLGKTVTITGTCPEGDSEAEAWYGAPGGFQPLQTGKMTKEGGELSITFTDLEPGSYNAVMACSNASETAVRRFIID